MRRKYAKSTSVIFWIFVLFNFIPISFSCIYLLNGWMPMSVYNRTAFADVVLSAHVIRTFKAREFRTAAQTYSAEVKIMDIYKGNNLLRNLPVKVKEPKVYNISNFGDRKMCYADVMEGDSYIFFLTTYKERLSAKYDDIFGAAAKYTEYNIREVLDQVGAGNVIYLFIVFSVGASERSAVRSALYTIGASEPSALYKRSRPPRSNH